MAATKKRLPITGIVGQLQAYQDIAEPLPSLPDFITLPDEALPFWERIVNSRTARDWRVAPTLLVTAANLAWTQYRINLMRRAQIEGVEFEEMTGAQLQTLINKTGALEMSYLRNLRQTGIQAWAGKNTEESDRLNLLAEMRAANPADTADGLLAAPGRRKR